MKTSLRKQLSIFVQRRTLIERRASKRIVPARRTLCLIQASGGEETTTLVHNVSCQGLAVQAEHAYAPGTLLHILLVNEAHTFALTMDVNVVRSIRMGDHYVTAGSFVRPLSHEEVVPFVQ